MHLRGLGQCLCPLPKPPCTHRGKTEVKTRELMRCDIRLFSERVRKLKAKELRRHIERVARDLGEGDVDAMMEALISALFSEEGVPETTSDEMDRVLAVIERRIPLTEQNMDAVLRLVGFQMAYIRQGVRKAAREERLAERHGEPLHHHCGDPHCTDPDHHHHG